MQDKSAYEEHALKEIHAWKNPEIGWFGQAMQVINQPLDKAGDALFKSKAVGDAIQKAIQGLMEVCNDAAAVAGATSATTRAATAARRTGQS